jgi:spore coat polysaccharide biosynthesis protein SpsF
LSRFEEVSKNSDSDIFVRITADDPLLDPNVTDMVIANFFKGDFDYVSNMVERSWPRGMDTEVFSRESLDATLENADLDDHKEHVTIFIRTNPDKFNIQNVSSLAQERMPDLRLCIDTQEDYEFLKIVFDNVYVKGEIIRVGEVLKFLRSNPQYLDINGSIEQRKIFGKVF